MLHLHQSYCAYPTGQLHHLVLPRQSVLVCPFSTPPIQQTYCPIQLYPSADAVIILNASSLALIRVLAFSEAFPHPEDRITSVSVDAGMKLVRPVVQVIIRFSSCLSVSR
jgi:hypothetical protein